jgi:CHAT domain-containing protein
VHLATHGRLSDVPGADSFLTLSGRAPNTANDGRLTTGEIYDLRLDADLVVLSACRSARGPVTGDGVLGMTRAFLYAGAPSIVATLWDVADRSGPELMPAFYRHWRHLSDKSAALREAQLETIARLRAGRLKVDTPGGARILPEHPFLWAAYILVGEI